MGKDVITYSQQRPTDEMLKRFLGEYYTVLSCVATELGTDINLHIAEVIPSASQDSQDEVALLNFYPVAEGRYFLQLTFIPEFNAQTDQALKVVQLIFQPGFFLQWPNALVCRKQPFRFDRSTEQAFALSGPARDSLDYISSFDLQAQDLVLMLRRQEAAIALLRFALEAFIVPDEANKLPACSFLNNNRERDKVMEAQRIIMERLDQPLTIRELSREVGMNECYLKKGFKAMFGKSIHEYFQFQRIERAKELLQQKDLSVNEVAFRLGFGSASHFSTSFKKIAGMKPCELLN